MPFAMRLSLHRIQQRLLLPIWGRAIMSIGAAPNIAGGLSVVAAGSYGVNLQQGIDPFAPPVECCWPPTQCCLTGGCQCGNNGSPGALAPMLSNSTAYPSLSAALSSCQCQNGVCPPPPPTGPYSVVVVTTNQSSNGVAGVDVFCSQTGVLQQTAGCR
jgi:hypothetical protein